MKTCITLTMKDEGPTVVEWVAHHLAVGFTEVMVYTNDCSDGTDTLLKRLEAMDGKAMIVCMSRRIAVDLYNAIIALRPDWASAKDDEDENVERKRHAW